jgi:hypothetical protein
MSNKLTALHAGQVLGRSEMKKIMAGSSDGFQQVGCNFNDALIGVVCCSFDPLACCQAHWPHTQSFSLGATCDPYDS